MNITVPDSQNSPGERQHVVKTKTIGKTGSEVPDDSFRAKLEFQQKQRRKQENDSSDEQAEKAKDKLLERIGERRHLKYDVIDEAGLVQMSVINSEDGTVIRKVPPDKVVEFVEGIRKNRRRTSRFDMML